MRVTCLDVESYIHDLQKLMAESINNRYDVLFIRNDKS